MYSTVASNYLNWVPILILRLATFFQFPFKVMNVKEMLCNVKINNYWIGMWTTKSMSLFNLEE